MADFHWRDSGSGGSGAQGAQGFQGLTGAQGAAGSQGAQGNQGAAGAGSTAPNNVTNTSYVGSGQVPASAGASSTNGQSSTGTFSTDNILFTVSDSASRNTMLCQTSYASADISAISDPGNIFLSSDAGVGIVVSKALNSNTLTFKNRTGVTTTITIQAINSAITSATVWA